MDKTFTFSTPDAIEIAYIVQRNKENDTFLNKLLIQAASLERLYSNLFPSKK